MAASIVTRLNTHYNRYNIVSVKYPGRPGIPPEKAGTNGLELPPGKKFSSNYEPPGVSFKTYRALVNHGQRSIADYVLQHRKRSYITPNAVWNGVMGFSRNTAPRTKLQSYSWALDKLRATLKVEDKIPIASIDDIIPSIPRGTSPGFPWIVSTPGLKKGDILDNYLDEIKMYWRGVGRGIPTMPLPDCAAFARSHISDPSKNKVRPVWAYPLHAICQEARFSQPLTELMKSQAIFQESAYGMEMMKGGMVWLNQQAIRARSQHPGCKFFSVDYSAFDSSVPAWLIRDVFGVISEKIDFSKMTYSEHIVSVDPINEKRKFKKIVDYFINTPIRNSDGRRFLKNHGIPSGSMFTNIIGTAINYVVSMCLSDCVFGEPPAFLVVFGDDSLLCLPDHLIADMDAYSQTAQNVFGMTVNSQKSVVTRNIRNIHFLGYYNNYGTPVKDPVDLIASMMYPQHEMDDWAYCISRALGCQLASAGASTDVFVCARAVWTFASRNENASAALERGLELIREHPRSRRFIDQMGCGELNLSQDYFHDITLSIPFPNCRKIMQRITLV